MSISQGYFGRISKVNIENIAQVVSGELEVTDVIFIQWNNVFNVRIHIVKDVTVVGKNTVSGNSRPLKGTIEILDNVCYFVLNEPGDNQFDGVFEFKIYKNSNNSLEGTWRSNDGTLTRDYRLYRL